MIDRLYKNNICRDQLEIWNLIEYFLLVCQQINHFVILYIFYNERYVNILKQNNYSQLQQQCSI